MENKGTIIVSDNTAELIELYRRFCNWQSDLISFIEKNDEDSEIIETSVDIHTRLTTLLGQTIGQNIDDSSYDKIEI